MTAVWPEDNKFYTYKVLSSIPLEKSGLVPNDLPDGTLLAVIEVDKTVIENFKPVSMENL